MAIDLPQFEQRDLVGSTDSYTGTVGTSFVPIPSSSGNRIQSFYVECSFENNVTDEIHVSLDGGTTTISKLAPGGYVSGLIKGTNNQIHIKANTTNVSYFVILNRENYV